MPQCVEMTERLIPVLVVSETVEVVPVMLIMVVVLMILIVDKLLFNNVIKTSLVNYMYDLAFLFCFRAKEKEQNIPILPLSSSFFHTPHGDVVPLQHVASPLVRPIIMQLKIIHLNQNIKGVP